MKAVKLFLILNEENKPCCKLVEEVEELDYNSNLSSDIMYTSINNGQQIGNSIYGSLENKEILKNKLFENYEKQLRDKRKELEKSEKLFSKLMKTL